MLPLRVVSPTKNSMSDLSRHAAGLKAWLHLVAAVAEAPAGEVVLSKPAFRDGAAQILPELPRPIDDVIATLGRGQPRRLRPFAAVVSAAARATGALTGSRASDLFGSAMAPRRRSGVISGPSLPPMIWEDLMTRLVSYFEGKLAFDRSRQGATERVPNPWAWRNRIFRKRTTRQLQRSKHAALPGNPGSAP
jgi:hypothetical protein